MSKKKTNFNINAKAKSKKAKSASGNPAVIKAAAGLLAKTSPKQSKSQKYGISKQKRIQRKRTKNEIEFTKRAKQHPDLQELIKVLPSLGLSLEEFLEKINLRSMLINKYNPKGTINEVFVLNDKTMSGILNDLGDFSIKSLTTRTDAELSVQIGNIKNKKFILKDFQKRKSKIASNFKTFKDNDNKQFLDFAIVRYQPAGEKLFIAIPGEIKEPRAAQELSAQFGRFINRLKKNEFIEFDLGNKHHGRIKTENVFFVKDNFVGVARRKSNLPPPRFGKDEFETDVFEKVHVNQGRTKDNQEFYKFLARINQKLNPDKIKTALFQIKKGMGIK